MKFGLTGIVVASWMELPREVLVSIYRELQLPIYFIGLGESPDDLQPFSIDNYLDSVAKFSRIPYKSQV